MAFENSRSIMSTLFCEGNFDIKSVKIGINRLINKLSLSLLGSKKNQHQRFSLFHLHRWVLNIEVGIPNSIEITFYSLLAFQLSYPIESRKADSRPHTWCPTLSGMVSPYRVYSKIWSVVQKESHNYGKQQDMLYKMFLYLRKNKFPNFWGYFQEIGGHFETARRHINEVTSDDLRKNVNNDDNSEYNDDNDVRKITPTSSKLTKKFYNLGFFSQIIRGHLLLSQNDSQFH